MNDENFNKYKNSGITRIIKAGGYSFNGFRAAWIGEAAFRQELILALLTLPFVFMMDTTSNQRSILVAATILVLIVELLNSAIEAIVDRVSLEHHELSGRAKDMGSAAVFCSLILWCYVWVEVLIG